MGRKKKILAIFLTLILMTTLMVGCGGSSGTTDTKQPETEKNEPAQGTDSNADTGEMGKLLSAAYVDMMKDNEYLMTYKASIAVEGQSMQVEATIAVSGDNTAMVSSGEGFESSIIIKDDKVYMVDHASKTVTSWAQTQDDESETIDTEGITYIGSGKEDGLVYEEYSTEGSNVRYYFNGENLAKISTTIDGQTMVMDIVKMSKDVPSSMFEIPEGYQLIEM